MQTFVFSMEGRYFAIVFLAAVVCKAAANPNVCPAIQCPMDRKISRDCRKAEFIIGTDGKTRCRVCDSNICKPRHETCPQIQCPGDGRLKDECRRPNFEIGADGITKCRMCDSSVCEKKHVTCPQIMCPDRFIPRRCREEQFQIGLDGITLCGMCDKNKCMPYE